MNFLMADLPGGARCFATDKPYFSVEPLGHASLVALVTGSDKRVPVVLHDVFETDRDGRRLPNRPLVDITVPITYRGRVSFFGLVPGGWVPPVIGGGRVALLDRNMVHRLRALAPTAEEVDPESPEWLFRLFAEGSFEVSLATHGLEGHWRRRPTMEEMAAELAKATVDLRASFPRAKIHQLEQQEQRALHALLMERRDTTEKSHVFLSQVAPWLVHAKKPSARRAFEDRILGAADDLRLRKSSLCVIAALSCLYEDPQLPAGDVYRPGRAVLKPKSAYGAAQAHNATADLTALEFLVNTHTMLRDYGAVFFTQDVGLAAFWSGLEVRDLVATDTGPATAYSAFTATLGDALFPALSEPERSRLAKRLEC